MVDDPSLPPNEFKELAAYVSELIEQGRRKEEAAIQSLLASERADTYLQCEQRIRAYRNLMKRNIDSVLEEIAKLRENPSLSDKQRSNLVQSCLQWIQERNAYACQRIIELKIKQLQSEATVRN